MSNNQKSNETTVIRKDSVPPATFKIPTPPKPTTATTQQPKHPNNK